MFTYRENPEVIVQKVEVDLSGQSPGLREELSTRLATYLPNGDNEIFEITDGGFVYQTEILVPKTHRNRRNLLLLFGNPAVHSIVEGMFFAYENRPNGGRVEHRLWRALRDCGLLKFELEPINAAYGNDYKRRCLRDGGYESDFNLFFLPYFSFPTPSAGPHGGVAGIVKILGRELYNEMSEFEFRRFKDFVLGNEIGYVVCFQRTVEKAIVRNAPGKEVSRIQDKPVYRLGGVLGNVVLYTSLPTRLLHTNIGRCVLKAIVSDIKNNSVTD